MIIDSDGKCEGGQGYSILHGTARVSPTPPPQYFKLVY